MGADRELLELAAKAIGMNVLLEGADWPREKIGWFFSARGGDEGPALFDRSSRLFASWAPLTDDGDALRLAVRLRLGLDIVDYGTSVRAAGQWYGSEAHLHGGIESATRRAIVLAAAEIGKAMP